MADTDRLPTFLNVLTILTFINSGLSVLLCFFAFAIAPFTYHQAVQNQGQMDQLPDFLKLLLGSNQVEAARLSLENRTPILLIHLLAAGLCTFGALRMRKLKKAGFIIYILGDFLPLSVYALIGFSLLIGIAFACTCMIAVTMIILYATQLKHMK